MPRPDVSEIGLTREFRPHRMAPYAKPGGVMRLLVGHQRRAHGRAVRVAPDGAALRLGGRLHPSSRTSRRSRIHTANIMARSLNKVMRRKAQG